MEDELPVAAGPVGVERGAPRDAGRATSLLMRVVTRNQALPIGLDFPGGPLLPGRPLRGYHLRTCRSRIAGSGAGPAPPWRPQTALTPIHGGIPEASGPLGRCTLGYMDGMYGPRAELQVRVRARLPRPPPHPGRRVGGPVQGAVHHRVGDTYVVLRGAALHRPGQLLPPLRGGLCRGRCTSPSTAGTSSLPRSLHR